MSLNFPLPLVGKRSAGLLLDQYAGAAAAYSLRELSDAWAGQPVVKVYRASDGATQDMNASEITNGTLATFLGTSDGFVNTWYDQSGNGFDATAVGTATNKPKIYTGATQTITTVNGKPALSFNKTLFGSLTNPGNIPYSGGVSWYAVLQLDTTNYLTRIWSDDIQGANGHVIFLTDGGCFINDNGTGYDVFNTANNGTSQEVSSFHFDDSNGNYEYARDGINSTGSVAGWTGPIGTSGSANFGIGGGGNGRQVMDGQIQELIIYPNNQSTNRIEIEDNISLFYTTN